MPAPDARPESRAQALRASASSTRPRRSTAAATRPSACVGDDVDVSADVFRDGHEILRAVVRYRRRPGAAAGRGAADAGRRPRQRRPLGGQVRGRRPPGRWQCTDRGVDRPLRHLARRAAAQDRGRPGRPRRRAVRGRRAAERGRRARQRRRPHDARPRSPTRSSRPATCARLDAALAPTARRRRARRRAHEREQLDPPLPLEVDRVRAPLRRLVRAVPALAGAA